MPNSKCFWRGTKNRIMPASNLQFAPFDTSLARRLANWDASYLVAPDGEYGFVVSDSRGKIQAIYKGRQYRGTVEGDGSVTIYALNPTVAESAIVENQE